MKKMKLAVVLAAAVTAFAAVAAFAADYGVVDVQKIYADSKPGKAAEAHMKEVRKVLQKGMDDVIKIQKGKENTPEGRRAITEAQQLLNRQLQIEQQAVIAVLDRELRAACENWLKANKKTMMLLPKQLTLAAANSVDVTAGVTKEMDKRKPKFPELPKVTINKPADNPAPAAEADKPAVGETKK